MVTRRVQTRLERKRTGPHAWLVVTRHPLADEGTCAGKSSPDARDQDARYGYRYYLTPTAVAKKDLEEPSLRELGRVITAGACIEASFKRGKGEVGMDEYQVRTWEGWHHHMALSLIAVWFLISETHRGQQWKQHLDNLRRKGVLPKLKNERSIGLLGWLFCLILCRCRLDTSLDPPTSPLRAERLAARDVLDAWGALHLSPRAASITAQRVGPILPPSHTQVFAATEVIPRHTVGVSDGTGTR